MAEQEPRQIIFDEHPTWKPGVFLWALILLILFTVVAKATPVAAIASSLNFLVVVWIFSYLRSRRGRTTLTDKEIIVHRGLFIVSKYHVPLSEIERVEVREPWLLKGGGLIWRLLDSYGQLEIFTRKSSVIPIRAENVTNVNKKKALIDARLSNLSS